MDLLTLGKVISSLADKNEKMRPPYRGDLGYMMNACAVVTWMVLCRPDGVNVLC